MNERPTPETRKAEQASLDDTGCVTRMEIIWETMERLERERDEAREELEDWRNAAKGAENPHPDEKHCTCVPLLRKLLHDAQKEIERLKNIEP